MGSEEEKNESFIGVNDIKLIDFLNEDDFLVDQRYRDSLEDLRLSVTFNDITEHAKAFKRVNQLKVAKKESVKPQVDEKLSNSGSLEARERITRPNAFGPSAGVSDLKGLSPINEELKGQGSVWSEDTSADSDFTFETFDGDAFSLERLEDEVFEDVRASIYRSCGTPIFSSASRDSGVAKAGKLNALSSNKGHVSSQNPRKSGANSTRQSPAIRKSKAVTTSSLNSQTFQQIKGGYDSTLTGQSKRGLSGYGSVKNRKTGEGLMAHKLSASVDSPGFMNLRTPPTKQSSRTATRGTRSPALARSSCDQFSSTLSAKSISSQGARTKGTSSSKIASSSSISKPPLPNSGRSRLSNHASPIHSLSMSQQFNSSPASSIGRWSSQSSSSTLRANAKLRAGNSEAVFHLLIKTPPAIKVDRFSRPQNFQRHSMTYQPFPLGKVLRRRISRPHKLFRVQVSIFCPLPSRWSCGRIYRILP
uniref:Uncharacterized protein n=1 Tax=Daucus carota subsp. sativus TaxID=79200 RepID=A0A164ZGI0_DAUCS